MSNLMSMLVSMVCFFSVIFFIVVIVVFPAISFHPSWRDKPEYVDKYYCVRNFPLIIILLLSIGSSFLLHSIGCFSFAIGMLVFYASCSFLVVVLWLRSLLEFGDFGDKFKFLAGLILAVEFVAMIVHIKYGQS